MRILFCADTFPSRFGPLAAAFAAEGHDVLFASHYGRRDFSIPGVKRVLLKPVRMRRSDDPAPGEAARQEWNKALATAHYADEAFASLRKRDFVPDMVVFAASSGAALALSRAFPEAVLFGFADSLHARSSREETEAVQLRMRACLAQSHACFAFSEQHLHSMPPLLRRAACLLPPAVDTEFFSPDAAQPFMLEGQAVAPSGACVDPARQREGAGCRQDIELVTVDLRSVPAASSRGLWNLCAGLLAHRPQSRIIMNCVEPDVREAAQSMAHALPEIWQKRLVVQEFKSLHEWRDMLCVSAVHICPEALSGSAPLPELLESMSCGVLLAISEDSAEGLSRFFQRLALHPFGAIEKGEESGSEAGKREPEEEKASSSKAVSMSGEKKRKILEKKVSESATHSGEKFAFFKQVDSARLFSMSESVKLSNRNNALFGIILSMKGTALQLESLCRVLDDRAEANRLKNNARSIIHNLCSQEKNVPVQLDRLLRAYLRCATENNEIISCDVRRKW